MAVASETKVLTPAPVEAALGNLDTVYIVTVCEPTLLLLAFKVAALKGLSALLSWLKYKRSTLEYISCISGVYSDGNWGSLGTANPKALVAAVTELVMLDAHQLVHLRVAHQAAKQHLVYLRIGGKPFLVHALGY